MVSTKMTALQHFGRPRTGLVAVAVGAAALLACRTPGVAPPAPLSRFRAASGGARWDANLAIATRASVSVGALSGTSESLEDVRTGRYRTTTRLGALEQGDGFDGTAAWQQAVGGEVVTLDAPDAVALATTMRWLVARGYFRDSAARYRDLGAARRGGQACHGVEATPVGGAPIELWFDDATGLLTQTSYREGTDTVVTTFDDYRTIDGVQLPFRTVIDPGDVRNRATLTVSEAHVGGPAADAAFARPRTDDDRLAFVHGARDSRVPFELINNHIYIRAAIDGAPVRMIVDTGGLNLLTPAAAARLGLATEGKLAISGAGDRKVDLGFARAKQLAVGDVQLANPVFYVVDTEALGDVEGEAFDGLVGFELLHRLAVRIDYPAEALTLMPQAGFAPPSGAITVPFELRDRTPVVTGSIDGIAARMTVDTGARTSLVAASPFTREQGLEARYRPAFETVTGWGVGGPTRGKPVRFRRITVGNAAVGDVVGELFTGDKGALADPDVSANLGGGVLRRFAVTFDYRGRKMYLEPARGVPRDIYDRAGMFMMRAGDVLRVVAVTPGGPAEHAGIAVDDRVVAIDGAPVASRRLAEWRAILGAGEIGARHSLTVGTGAAQRDRTLVLAELLP
jgi:predicted aspartyl protease